MKEQTAMQSHLQWLNENQLDFNIPLEVIEDAEDRLEMEKQQIIDAYANAVMKENNSDYIGMHEQSSAEIYFAETYGSKGCDENFKQFSLYEHKETITSSDTKVSETFLDHVPDVRNMVSSQTEISDEEIEKRVKEVGAMGEYYKMAYRDAIIWYREQLKQRQ